MKRITSFLAAAVFLISSPVFAHGNMDHVMGTVSELTTHSISVKATNGTVKVVEFDQDTKFLKGDASVTIKDVHIGDRVVIHAHKHDNDLHAAEVRIGAMTKAATQK